MIYVGHAATENMTTPCHVHSSQSVVLAAINLATELACVGQEILVDFDVLGLTPRKRRIVLLQCQLHF